MVPQNLLNQGESAVLNDILHMSSTAALMEAASTSLGTGTVTLEMSSCCLLRVAAPGSFACPLPALLVCTTALALGKAVAASWQLKG